MKGFWVLPILCACTLTAFAKDHSTGWNHYQNMMLRADTAKADSTAKDTADDEDIKHREFEIGLEGASDQSHYGLKNNVKIPYIEPSFTYKAKNGFYVETGDKDILVKKGGGFDELSLNPGWDFDVTDNTTLNANFTFFHYKTHSSVLIKSNMWGTLEGYVDQYLGNLEGKLSVDYDMYKGKVTPNDIAITPDIMYNQEWDFGKKSSLTLIPEANIDFGTRNFYTQYEEAAANDSAASGLKVKRKLSSIPSNSSFGALDYNLILTVQYTVGKFTFEPAINYTHPLYSSPGIPSSPLTFGSITITYAIKSKK